MSTVVDQLLEAPCTKICELESRWAWSLGDPPTLLCFPLGALPLSHSEDWGGGGPHASAERGRISHFEIHLECSVLLNQAYPQEEVFYQSFYLLEFYQNQAKLGERKHPTRVPSHFAVSPKGKVGRTQKNKTEKHLWRS